MQRIHICNDYNLDMNTPPNRQKIRNALMTAGIKPSTQRIAIAEYLWSSHSHPTADEIYNALLPEYPTMSRTTIYNTLKLLVASGSARVLETDSMTARFDGDTSYHAHFICSECGEISDIAIDEIPKPPAGHNVKETFVTFRGVCCKCANKKENNQN